MPCRGPKKEAEKRPPVGHRLARSISSIIRVGFRNTSSFDRRTSRFPFTTRIRPRARRSNRRKSIAAARRRSALAARPLTCPCCSAVPPLLDCSPWTDSCCCIHSSVSLQEDGRNEAMKIVCYIAPDRSAKFLVGNGGPRQVFPPPGCKCNSTRRSLHFT